MYVYSPGHSRIVSVGVYIPENRLTSRELFESFDSRTRFDIPHDWLERTMGIRERRVAPVEMMPSDMAILAARDALNRGGVSPSDIDVIIFCGVFRDHIEPASAHRVQDIIGAKNAIVFDVTNACHGFMNGIHLMDALIATGQARRGLLVTGEQSSQAVRRAVEILKSTHDRDVFRRLAGGLTLGDAGAAMILGPKQDPDTGFRGFMLCSKGEHSGLCTYGERSNEAIPVQTDMSTIVRAHLEMHAEMYQSCMRKLGWTTSEIDKLVSHQVGLKAFGMHSEYSGVPVAHMTKTVTDLGNLVTATIPVNLHQLECSRDMNVGDKIFIAGAGSGLSISQAGLIWEQAA